MDVTLSPELGRTCDAVDLVVCAETTAQRELATSIANELAARSHALSTVRQLGAEQAGDIDVIHCCAQAGAIPIVTAPMLHDVLRSGVEQVVAIGPYVEPDHVIANKPLLVAMDSVVRTEPLIEAVAAFATADTPRVIVTQVIAPSATSAGFTIGRESAKFAAHINAHVDAVVVSGDGVGVGIAQTALLEDAGLVIARSWHLRQADHTATVSTSVSIVAEAPCPVLIVQ